jgi:hypothetical protein
MYDLEEDIIDSIKTLILPEIRKLQDGVNGICVSQDALEKKIISTNVLSNSRRIDEANKRIDLIYVEIGNIKKEMERLKREDAVTADILHRMEVLEEKVLLKQ